MKKYIMSMLMFLLMCSPAKADELSELKEMFQQMQNQMKQTQNQMGVMQERIDQLEREKNEQASQDKTTINQLQVRVDELEQTEKKETKSLLSTLNPEVSVIGDLIYKSDENGGEGDNDFNLREVELAISANVDTWARGDVVVAFENEDGSTEVALEEGYLTLLELPIENFQAKFGKFRPYFGKVNKMHLHNMPWSDRPLVIQNFFGEGGFKETGVSLSYLIPNPADIYSELTLEGINNSSSVFGDGEDGDTAFLIHSKNFFEITDDTSLEIGGSYAFGENENEGGAQTKISGFDITLNTELFDNRRTTSHTEALFNTREQTTGDDINSWGMFTSFEQQLTDKWWAFARYDFTQTPTSSEYDTNSYSTGLTFAQSEYVFWRAMFQHKNIQNAEDDNTVWLQMDFSLGPHKPHAYR